MLRNNRGIKTLETLKKRNTFEGDGVSVKSFVRTNPKNYWHKGF